MNGELLSPIVCLLAIVPVRVNADYPVMSHRYLADPTSLVVDDRVYIYCSNDDESPVEGGYNIYVGGNGGVTPRHATVRSCTRVVVVAN